MAWFGAKILMRSFIPKTGEELLGEETVRLVSAKNLEDAEKKAIKLGKTLQHKYKSADGAMIHVRFQEVLDVYDIQERIHDGVEIYSLLITPKEVAYYMKMYRPKGFRK
jgi:hypothetical protein